MRAIVGLCILKIHLPESQSLKDKRSVIKSMLKRLHNQFNVSASEVDQHDRWQLAEVAITVVSNETRHVETILQKCVDYIEENYLQVIVTDRTFEIF